MVEQAKFCWPEMNFLIGPAHLMSDTVNFNIPKARYIIGQPRTDPPQHRLNPRYQFAHGKGLGHIIISASIKAANTVYFFGARRQHNHRNIFSAGAAAQAATNFNTGHLGQHPIENNNIGGFFFYPEQTFLAITGYRNFKPFTL